MSDKQSMELEEKIQRQKLYINEKVQVSFNRRFKILKMMMLVFFTSLFILYRIFIQLQVPSQNFNQERGINNQNQQITQNVCIIDLTHILTNSINEFIHKKRPSIIIIIGQFLIDGWLIFMIIFWVSKVRNTRYPSSVGLFYGVRSLFLNLIKLPYPQRIIWDDTQIPSISVPYGITSDFFYSGHTGMVVLVFCQLIYCKCYRSSILCFFSIAYIILMLLSTRVHYSVDIAASIIISIYFFQMVTKFKVIFDIIMNLPFNILKFIFCLFCKQKDTININTQNKQKVKSQGQMQLSQENE